MNILEVLEVSTQRGSLLSIVYWSPQKNRNILSKGTKTLQLYIKSLEFYWNFKSCIKQKLFFRQKYSLGVLQREVTLNWSFSAALSFVIFTQVHMVGLFHWVSFYRVKERTWRPLPLPPLTNFPLEPPLLLLLALVQDGPIPPRPLEARSRGLGR